MGNILLELSEKEENSLIDNYGRMNNKSSFEKLVISNIVINKLRKLVNLYKNGNPDFIDLKEKLKEEREKNILLESKIETLDGELDSLVCETKHYINKIKVEKNKNKKLESDIRSIKNNMETLTQEIEHLNNKLLEIKKVKNKNFKLDYETRNILKKEKRYQILNNEKRDLQIELNKTRNKLYHIQNK